MINLTINGKEVSVEPGTSILDACKKYLSNKHKKIDLLERDNFK